jgi:predicted DNA-binding helix-hairpin-helix protein
MAGKLASVERLCYSGGMDLLERLSLAAEGARHEAADAGDRPSGGPGCGMPPARGLTTYAFGGRNIPIYPAVGPGGRRFPLLKAMLTTICERDCNYCSFRSEHDQQRVTFRPDEMAQAFDQACRAGWVQGLFLSSGIAGGGANTQERLIATAEILRRRFGFRGYIHLKIMPGAEREQVLRAMRIASRVSINLEAPNADRLPALAPSKSFDAELLPPLRWASAARTADASEPRLASSATQFVVGAAGESDLEILSTVQHAFQQLGLARAFFQSFNPVPDTPLENAPPESPLRQNRLYEASYLLRDYGFDLEDLPFAGEGNLPLDTDPKTAYAQRALAQQPVELNTADRELLLRIPGVGPQSVHRLLVARKQGHLRDLSHLRRLGILAERAAPYVTLMGRRPPRQLSFLPQFADSTLNPIEPQRPLRP